MLSALYKHFHCISLQLFIDRFVGSLQKMVFCILSNDTTISLQYPFGKLNTIVIRTLLFTFQIHILYRRMWFCFKSVLYADSVPANKNEI